MSLVIFNLLKNKKILLGELFFYKTFLQRLHGFAFYLKPSLPQHLVFYKVACIHTFFVFFKLAVVVLDKNCCVIDKFIIKPWRISKYYPRAYWLIESTDYAVIDKVAVGSQLEFKQSSV